MKSTHRHTCWRRSTLLFIKPLLYKEHFQQGNWKQNLFAFLHPTFNFLLSVGSVGIFPYFVLSSFPPVKKGLSLKFMLSRTGTNTRPEHNRPTYLPCSFIYPPPGPSLHLPRLWIDHGCCKMTAVSCALALQINWKKKGWGGGRGGSVRRSKGLRSELGESGSASRPSALRSSWQWDVKTWVSS